MREGNLEEEEILDFSVSKLEESGRIEMNFGKPVAWIRLSAEDAVKLGELLIQYGKVS